MTRDRSKKARKTKSPVQPVDEIEREDESPQNPEDLSDAITTESLKPSKAAIAKWVALLQTQVTQWLTEGVPMAEIRDRIPTLYERLNGDELAKALSQGIQLGYLGGLGEEEEG